MTQKVEISARTIIFTVLFLILLKVIWMSRELIFSIFLAFIFMSALKPVVYWLERRRFPHGLSVVIVFLTVVLSIIFLLAFVFPPLVTESIIFIKTFPTLVESAFSPLSFYIRFESVDKLLPEPKDVIEVIKNIFSNFIFLISVVFFTFYFLLEEKFFKNFLERFLEVSESEKTVSVFNKCELRMGAWIRGQLVLMTIIGLMTYIGLMLLDVPYAFPLALLAGLFEIVPIIGPIASAVPAVFVGLSVTPFLGVSIVALYFIIQQIENNVVVPVVMRKTVGINPILTLMALTVGGKLGGFIGILLAVPAALLIETILIEATKLRR